MKILKINQYLNITMNQFRLKTIIKHVYLFDFFKHSLVITLRLTKQKSFLEDSILETFLLLDFLSFGKCFINNIQKKYQQVNLQFLITLRKYNLHFFLLLLQFFYFPLFIRRNIFINSSFDSTYNCVFNLTEINILPFISDIYFK